MWLQDQMLDATRPDALSIVFLGTFLSQNITVMTTPLDFTLYEELPIGAVVLYNGGNKWTSTEAVPSE